MRTAAEILVELVRRVLGPSVASGRIVLGRPFGPRRARLAAEAFGHKDGDRHLAALTRELGGTVDDGLLSRLRALSPLDAPALGSTIDGPTIELAASMHDALAAFHPDLAGLFRGAARERVLELAIESMVALPPPATVRGALFRHAWLGALPRFSLARVDVRWWTGSATFIGCTPPSRLLAWPGARRVQRNERRVPALRLPELFDARLTATLGDAYARALAAFFAASPLTDLAFAGRLAPPFAFGQATRALLSLPVGVRLARRAIASGEDGGRLARDAIAATRSPEAALLA